MVPGVLRGDGRWLPKPAGHSNGLIASTRARARVVWATTTSLGDGRGPQAHWWPRPRLLHMTTGTVAVAFLTASMAGVPAVTITSILAARFCNEGRKPFVSSFRPAKHDLDVPTLLVAMLAQAFVERSDEIGL